MPLDETALRKPEFVEGARVKLGDGQEWSLPRPRVQLVPGRTEDGRFELQSRLIFGGQRQADLDAMFAAAEGGETKNFEWLEARMRLAAGLLLDNYDLDDEALADLMPIEFGDEANHAMWAEIDAALMGRAPKA